MEKTEIRPTNELKKSSNSETSTIPAQRLPSTAEQSEKSITDTILLDSSPNKPDEPLMKELSVLKEKLESFMMCQICYE